jgi:hypothetical protein
LPGYPGTNIFLSKEHVMKRHLFPLLIVALILPALAGCPQDSGDSTPSGTLGDGELVLKGKVYTQTFDESVYEYKTTLYTTAGTVEVWASSSGGSSEKLGEGPLTDGDFNISVTQKPSASLAAFNTALLPYLFSGWDNPMAEPVEAKGAPISLHFGNDRIMKSRSTVSRDRMTDEAVLYLYVDKDVTITLGANEESDTEDGFTSTITYKATTLKLAQGWNALYQEYEIAETSNGQSGTVSISVKNPDLDWVLND